MKKPLFFRRIEKIRFALIAVLAVGYSFAPSTEAATVVVDFDNATPGSLLTANYLEDGISMQSTAGHYDIFATGGFGNTSYVGLDTVDLVDSQVRFTGGVFNLVSFNTFNWTASIGEFLTVTSSAGGFVSSETNGILVFTAPAALPFWTNLTWLNFSSNASVAGPGFDTVTLNTVVPIPAAIWLFASGLLGLIGIAKRKQL